ncbi:MAG: hypothetical protein IPG50_02865 [Myxococcales bacterium]|nr:hypothetical protein [Myxococcales bacterium]
MRLRPALAIGLVIAGPGCGTSKLKDALRDEYCSELESSPTFVDNAFATTASFLDSLRMTQDALQWSIDGGGDPENLLWIMAGNCRSVALTWAEAVGNARAFHRTWWSVRVKTGELIIEPPAAPALSKALDKMCDAGGLRVNPANRASSLRAAAAHRAAALEELLSEQRRWATERDRGLARCEAAAWKRRHEPGYFAMPMPSSRDSDAGARER